MSASQGEIGAVEGDIMIHNFNKSPMFLVASITATLAHTALAVFYDDVEAFLEGESSDEKGSGGSESQLKEGEEGDDDLSSNSSDSGSNLNFKGKSKSKTKSQVNLKSKGKSKSKKNQIQRTGY